MRHSLAKCYRHGVTDGSVRQFVEHYNSMMYQGLLNATKNSLAQVKDRVCAKGGGTGFLFVDAPFFEAGPSAPHSHTSHPISQSAASPARLLK